MSSEIKLIKYTIKKPMTLKYPSSLTPEKKYSQIPDGLRGLLQRDNEKCIGCKACHYSCSGKATTFQYKENKLIIETFTLRCAFCGYCQEICPEEAIKLTKTFEITINNPNEREAYITTELDLLKCKNCGKYFATKKFIDRTYQRLIEKIEPIIKESVMNDYKKIEEYCTDCRRMLSVKLNTHPKKYVWLEG
jgi:formate hydrogenlyase subunit 6/NADH:ubiquinone oxidoreductase subunit I